MHEDNAGVLTLLKNPPPQQTQFSKHYVMKTNCIHEQIIAQDSHIFKIDMKEQQGNIFTKLLPEVEYLQKQIMG